MSKTYNQFSAEVLAGEPIPVEALTRWLCDDADVAIAFDGGYVYTDLVSITRTSDGIVALFSEQRTDEKDCREFKLHADGKVEEVDRKLPPAPPNLFADMAQPPAGRVTHYFHGKALSEKFCSTMPQGSVLIKIGDVYLSPVEDMGRMYKWTGEIWTSICPGNAMAIEPDSMQRWHDYLNARHIIFEFVQTRP